jgi:uncharacterized protein YigE (DUF2233 family)
MCRMNPRIALVVVACAVGSAGTEPVCLQRQVSGPGLLVEQWYDGDGPWVAWVAHVDLRNPELTLAVRAPSGTLAGLALPSEFCRANPRAVLAVNGDYFDAAGVPIGICISDGRLLKTGRGWSYFAMRSDGRAAVGRGEPKIMLVTDSGDTVKLGGLNPARPADAPYLVGRRGGPAPSPGENSSGALDLSARLPWPIGRVTTSLVDPRAERPTCRSDSGSLLLVNPPPSLAAGSSVALAVDAGELLRSVRETIGGGPRIVRSGSVSVEYGEEGTSEAHALDRHPRTAVGVSGDGSFVWIAVVDGRRPGHSRGVDLHQLGAFMVQLGCSDAVNLDGGGSSVMVLRGESLSLPSDTTGERPVANVLAVFSREPPGAACRARVQPPPNPLACGGLWLPVAWLEDALGWTLSQSSATTWVGDPSLGAIDADGFLTPRRSGWLRLVADEASDSLLLTCEPPSEVRICPPLLSERSRHRRSPVPVVLAHSPDGSPLAVAPRLSAAAGQVRVEAGELGVWSVPVLDRDSFVPLASWGPEFAVQDSLVGLPFDFSTGADTLTFRLGPAPEAAGLRLELLAERQGVHVAASFMDAAGHIYGTDLTSFSEGAYWEGWHEVKAYAADCTAGDGVPAMLPLRLESLAVWPGVRQARAGTLWVRSASILASGSPAG